MRRQNMRGACWRWKCEVMKRRGLSEVIFALAVPPPHFCTGSATPHFCTGSASPRADVAPTQPQCRSGKHCVASAHKRSTLGSENRRFLGWRGLSEIILALAVPAWHHTVLRTVNHRNYGKLWSSKIVITP